MLHIAEIVQVMLPAAGTDGRTLLPVVLVGLLAKISSPALASSVAGLVFCIATGKR
jgi:hypothetical protein